MKKFYNWIDENKNSNSLVIQMIKIIYSCVTKEWLQLTISTLFTISISVALAVDNNNYRTWWFWLVFCLFVVEGVGYNICLDYSHRQFRSRKMYDQIVSNTDAIINSLTLLVQGNRLWRSQIFKQSCLLVCNSLYHTLSKVYDVNNRVSIEYQFLKGNERVTKMIGRCSNHRNFARPNVYKLTDNSKKYSHKVLNGNKIGIHLIEKDDFQARGWYINTSHGARINIQQYLAVASTLNDSEVAYILQIDSLNKAIFGDNLEEVEDFVERFLKPYTNILSMAYIMNTDKYGNIPEV